MNSSEAKAPVVLAAVAHPDDIEFYFSGTLLLLKAAGCSIHMWNLANGCCGTMLHSHEEICQIRLEEAKASASLLGAFFHAPLFNDLEIFYDKPSLLAVSSILRSIAPDIIVTHSPHDYMEDHQNVCRLITTAAFSRGMPNYLTKPEVPFCEKSTRIYHAAPHGLQDAIGTPFYPSHLIDVASVMDLKRQMLACHRSQHNWLHESQGMNAFVVQMEAYCSQMASLANKLEFAEGWRRHSHLGFCEPDFDPLQKHLKDFCKTLITESTADLSKVPVFTTKQ